MLSPTEEIKSKLDIIDLIQEYFPLKQSGVNFKAKCPFHEEKTPSFMVNREKQFYHCFGCSESGDVFTFLQKMESIEFPEALKILANKAGVKLPEYNPQMSNLKTKVLSMQDMAAEYFHNQLLNSESGKQALSYLKQTRRMNDQTIKDWQLGYALDSWQALSDYLKSKGFNDQELLQSGLVVAKERGGGYYDRFRDRVMFPIEDYHGNVVGFTGRSLREEESAKYINTPQSLVYNKSEVIFGLYKAKEAIKEKNSVVIVEGNMDVIASAQTGVKNVVAVSGTALTGEQIKILQRLTNNIIFAFDADSAGIRAVERSINLAWQAEANVKVIAIDQNLGKDPDDIIQRDSGVWSKLVDTPMTAMDYFFKINLDNYQPDNIETKKEIAKNLLNYIIKLSNPVEQDFYIKKLAEEIEVNETSLREALQKAKIRKPKIKQTAQPEPDGQKKKPIDKKISVAERLIAYLLVDADYIEYISENLLIEHFPFELQDLYKLIIVYYTKNTRDNYQPEEVIESIKSNRPDLVTDINKISLLVAEEVSGLTYNEAIAQIKQHVAYLKKEFIKHRLQQVSQELKQAEKQPVQDKQKINELLNQFTKLSVELKETDF